MTAPGSAAADGQPGGDQAGENTCPDCAGTGTRDGGTCSACAGSGVVTELVGDA